MNPCKVVFGGNNSMVSLNSYCRGMDFNSTSEPDICPTASNMVLYIRIRASEAVVINEIKGSVHVGLTPCPTFLDGDYYMHAIGTLGVVRIHSADAQGSPKCIQSSWHTYSARYFGCLGWQYCNYAHATSNVPTASRKSLRFALELVNVGSPHELRLAYRMCLSECQKPIIFGSQFLTVKCR